MDSPLGDDSDHEGDFSLTPRTEAKYNKIDEEFHLMMQRNQLNGVRVSSLVLPSDSVTTKVRNDSLMFLQIIYKIILFQGGQQGGGQGFSMPVTVPVNSSYTESSLLTSPQQSVSPRPPSHDMLEVSQTQTGGYSASVASPSPGPGQTASSPSPQSLKRGATSPEHGGGQHSVAMTNRNNLRVVIPQSGGREAADPSLGGGGLNYGDSNHGHGNFQSDFGELPLQHWNQSHLQSNNHK